MADDRSLKDVIRFVDPSSFKPIKPVGSSPTIARPNTNPNGPQDDDSEGQELDTALQDPQTKNRPEVRQIQSLLQRMKK